jgi:hypothetical protein
MKKAVMPLQLVSIEEPFTQWGLELIGSTNPKSSKGYLYILTTTDYFTKSKEEVELKKEDSNELIRFLKENIIEIFGIPENFIIDNGSIFIGSNFTNFYGEFGIIMRQ